MAIAFDKASASARKDNAATVDWTHAPVGTPTLVVVTIPTLSVTSGNTFTATYDQGGANQQSMTQAFSRSAADDFNEYNVCFYLENPAAGSASVTIRVTTSGGIFGYTGATSWTGAFASPPIIGGNEVYQHGGSVASDTINYSSTAGNYVLDMIQATSGTTLTQNQTVDYNSTTIAGGGYQSGAQHAAGGGSVAMTWNFSPNSTRSHTAFEILASSGAAFNAGRAKATHTVGIY